MSALRPAAGPCYPRQPLAGPLPERHPVIAADATGPFCLDCGGRGFDTDDDGSMTGVVGAWMVCGCFPDHQAHWPWPMADEAQGRGGAGVQRSRPASRQLARPASALDLDAWSRWEGMRA